MNKTRLEAFSNGAFVIILTIIVLEIKVPHSSSSAALRPVLLGYWATVRKVLTALGAKVSFGAAAPARPASKEAR